MSGGSEDSLSCVRSLQLKFGWPSGEGIGAQRASPLPSGEVPLCSMSRTPVGMRLRAVRLGKVKNSLLVTAAGRIACILTLLGC